MITIICPKCGLPFDRYPSYIARIASGTLYCSRLCKSLNKRGKYFSTDGYIRVSTGHGKHAFEHRLIAEKSLGRKLLSSEHVHHINGDPSDNRSENLSVMDASEHQVFHKRKLIAIESVKAMASNGLTTQEIGNSFGVCGVTVSRALKISGAGTKRIICNTRAASVSEASLRNLCDRGFTVIQISAELGVSENTVCRRLRKFGLETVRQARYGR